MAALSDLWKTRTKPLCKKIMQHTNIEPHPIVIFLFWKCMQQSTRFPHHPPAPTASRLLSSLATLVTML